MEDQSALKFIKQSLCPFCQCENSCGIDEKNSCWCFDTEVPRELLTLISDNSGNKACICLKCINLFNQNAEYFKEIYLQKKK